MIISWGAEVEKMTAEELAQMEKDQETALEEHKQAQAMIYIDWKAKKIIFHQFESI